MFVGRFWGVRGEKTATTASASTNYNLYTLYTHYKCINRGCIAYAHPYLFTYIFYPSTGKNKGVLALSGCAVEVEQGQSLNPSGTGGKQTVSRDFPHLPNRVIAA